MRFDKNWLVITWKHTSNLDEVIFKAPPNSDFGIEARIWRIGWFYRPKWKIFEKSASKNKHPINLRFSNWSLQSDNPKKKLIPEKHEFGSYPSHIFWINLKIHMVSPLSQNWLNANAIDNANASGACVCVRFFQTQPGLWKKKIERFQVLIFCTFKKFFLNFN